MIYLFCPGLRIVALLKPAAAHRHNARLRSGKIDLHPCPVDLNPAAFGYETLNL